MHFSLTKLYVSLWEKSRRFEGKITLVCGKNHVGLWEKSRRFVGKIMSVCGKNHVGLREKSLRFVGKITSVCGKNLVGLWEKSCRFVGKICWTENFTEKYPHMHRKKIPDYLRLFAEVPRLTTFI